jgi:hypothetical protein
MRIQLGGLLAMAFGVVLLAGCPGTKNTPHGSQVTVGLTGLNEGDRITTASRPITITTSSTAGHITHVSITIDGTSVFEQDYDNSSVTKNFDVPGGVLNMGAHTLVTTCTDAHGGTGSKTVNYTVNP